MLDTQTTTPTVGEYLAHFLITGIMVVVAVAFIGGAALLAYDALKRSVSRETRRH